MISLLMSFIEGTYNDVSEVVLSSRKQKTVDKMRSLLEKATIVSNRKEGVNLLVGGKECVKVENIPLHKAYVFKSSHMAVCSFDILSNFRDENGEQVTSINTSLGPRNIDIWVAHPVHFDDYGYIDHNEDCGYVCDGYLYHSALYGDLEYTRPVFRE